MRSFNTVSMLIAKQKIFLISIKYFAIMFFNKNIFKTFLFFVTFGQIAKPSDILNQNKID